MAKVISPSDRKIKNLSKKIEDAHIIHAKMESKMDTLLETYVNDCIKRKDSSALSVLVDKMPKHYFGTFYLYQAIAEIRINKNKSK